MPFPANKHARKIEIPAPKPFKHHRWSKQIQPSDLLLASQFSRPPRSSQSHNAFLFLRHGFSGPNPLRRRSPSARSRSLRGHGPRGGGRGQGPWLQWRFLECYRRRGARENPSSRGRAVREGVQGDRGRGLRGSRGLSQPRLGNQVRASFCDLSIIFIL